LPVNPRAGTTHHLFSDAALDFLEGLGFELHTLGMVFPPLKVMQIFFERLSRLGMCRPMRNVWILLVSRTFVILRSVRFPVSKTHPAKVVLTVVTLHMIAAAVFLNADVTPWAVFGVRRNVVCSFTVIRTLCEPAFNGFAVSGRMILAATLEAEAGFARNTNASFC